MDTNEQFEFIEVVPQQESPAPKPAKKIAYFAPREPKKSVEQKPSASEANQCYMCGQVFKRRDHLKTHMEDHAIVKNHPCLMCDKSFIHKVHLTKHKYQEHFPQVNREIIEAQTEARKETVIVQHKPVVIPQQNKAGTVRNVVYLSPPNVDRVIVNSTTLGDNRVVLNPIPQRQYSRVVQVQVSSAFV